MFLNYAEFLFNTSLIILVKYRDSERARVTVYRQASGLISASVSVPSTSGVSLILGNGSMTLFVEMDMFMHFSEMGMRFSDGYTPECSKPMHGGCVLTVTKDE